LVFIFRFYKLLQKAFGKEKKVKYLYFINHSS
jgi:hypothetical protein